MTLARKVALLTVAGVVLAVVAFGLLSLRAVDQATVAMLQDRLTTAQVVADYVDEALDHAVTELRQTADKLGGPVNNTAEEVRSLRASYERLSISLRGVYLLNEQGEVTWSEPGAPTVSGKDMSLVPTFNQTIKSGLPTVSALVRAPKGHWRHGSTRGRYRPQPVEHCRLCQTDKARADGLR
jgi:hypothetical protein